MLLLDVPFDSDGEAAFLWALIERSPGVLITIPAGDARAVARLAAHGVTPEVFQDEGTGDLSHLTRYLFSSDPPPARQRSEELIWFSAPGEGRESVEIARRMLKEASQGVRFDEMAVLVRSTQQYVGVLEHALSRAGIPAYFDRGTRRPHPAGRAFLAMLSCVVENFSARRFAEYLSLAQVPGQQGSDPFVQMDEIFGVLSEPPGEEEAETVQETAGDDESPDAAVFAGTLRAPWKWESLLVESAVIGGAERWRRRLRGLREEYQLKLRELRGEDPDSARIPHIEREIQNLGHLSEFALPLIEEMSAWPISSTWGEWLGRLETLAPRVLRRTDQVRRVLADLRPMASVGPVGLAEVRDVLRDRLLSLEVDPPTHRYGRVFIGSPHQARGRAFRVVFVPGLAERLFPQKLREDPLLLDDLRVEVGAHLTKQNDRADLERLLLRLAVGAASERLYVSFPRIESTEARQRVPSFYALEIMRAVTGRVPDHQALEREAAIEANAHLAWPAPAVAEDAIDDLEHDLSVLRVLMRSNEDVRGHAHYMLRLNECLRRSATERWARAKRDWTQFDGLVRVTDGVRPFLASQRLGARAYSVSALQNFAYCPYRFFLSAMYRLEPLEEPEPLQRMDPLTRGSLFHEVQAEFFRALQRDELAIETAPIDRVLAVLNATIDALSKKYSELLAPAVERVWEDEIAGIRTDLHIWARELSTQHGWEPWRFEYAFGLADEGRDPNSRHEAVMIDGRFLLRGSVDLIERKPGTQILRITDHKTSRNRSVRHSILGGGQQLQPVIYSLAVEAATNCVVESGRFSYCTTAGGFTEHTVPINERTRRMGIEVLEIVDRAIESGMLPPAPAERACMYCDFLSVCGPNADRRAAKKSKQQIADLLELRNRP
jgi:ATP-dependent helicase/DNAse subunit B